MKNTVLLLILLCSISISISIASAQTEIRDLGVKGGLNFTFFNVSEANFGENSETATGYYGGLYLNIDFGENLHLQPEILYIGLNDFRFINAPIYINYKASKTLDILVGPSMNYFFDFFNNKFKVRADLSLSYNITNHINTHAKYTIGFDEITPNGLFLGVGYRFL